MRDAKVTQIYEGTNQIQRVVIAQHLLGSSNERRSMTDVRGCGSRRRRPATLHVGGARTALFNWLYARHDGGDVRPAHRGHRRRPVTRRVDRRRSRTRCAGSASTGTRGPFLQSDRASTSTARPPTGCSPPAHAYECYCTADELEARNDAARKARAAAGLRRPLPRPHRRRARRAGAPRAGRVSIRFRTPDDGVSTLHRPRPRRGRRSSGRRSPTS